MGGTISQVTSQEFPPSCVTRGAAIKGNVLMFNRKTALKSCFISTVIYIPEHVKKGRAPLTCQLCELLQRRSAIRENFQNLIAVLCTDLFKAECTN